VKIKIHQEKKIQQQQYNNNKMTYRFNTIHNDRTAFNNGHQQYIDIYHRPTDDSPIGEPVARIIHSPKYGYILILPEDFVNDDPPKERRFEVFNDFLEYFYKCERPGPTLSTQLTFGDKQIRFLPNTRWWYEVLNLRTIKRLEGFVQARDVTIEHRNHSISALQRDIHERDSTIERLRRQIQTLSHSRDRDATIEELQNKIQDRDITIEGLHNENHELLHEVQHIREQYHNLKKMMNQTIISYLKDHTGTEQQDLHNLLQNGLKLS
jgi:uncharacterized protein YoxC